MTCAISAEVHGVWTRSFTHIKTLARARFSSVMQSQLTEIRESHDSGDLVHCRTFRQAKACFQPTCAQIYICTYILVS